MILFLTSSAGENYVEGDKRFPCVMDERNRFVERMKAALPENPNCLIISSDPADYETNDFMHGIFTEAHKMTGMPLGKAVTCDNRNCVHIKEQIKEADYIILCGGHVPTQNAFFHRIGLKEALAGFGGVIMSISAGTMNSAKLVYSIPEYAEEVNDPSYVCYYEGLGLTDIRVLPHFQYYRDLTVGGKRVVEDVALPDSYVESFYAMVDGSYLYIKDGKTVLCGEGYYVADGKLKLVCREDEELVLS